MATTKKTEKKDDVKKTTAKKPAAKKKTTVKKEVESTGVVDEFLSNAIGETITKEEAEKQPEPKKKKTTTKKNDVKQNDEIVTYPGLTTEKYLVDEEFTEKWEKLGLGEDVQEEIKEIVDNVHNQQESNTPNNSDDVRSENYANEVNTLVKKWDDTNITVNNNEKGEIAKAPVEKQNRFYNPRHDVYPPITEVNKKTEEKKPEEKSVMTYTTTKETSAPVTVESLRVKFEDQKTENNFTFVTTSMGVRYD